MKKRFSHQTKSDGSIEPKPPEFLAKLLWVLKHGKKHWKLILLALFIFVLYLAFNYGLPGRVFQFLQNKRLSDAARTQLYPRTKKRVDDIYDNIEKEKLNPWIFINTGKMPEVTKRDGKIICYKGVMFQGTPRLVFWSDDFVPPLIEDAIIEVFDETIAECRNNNLDPKAYVDEANRLLNSFIWKIYNRMADIDRDLSGKSAHRKDVSWEAQRMQERLKEHYDAAVLLASKDGNRN